MYYSIFLLFIDRKSHKCLRLVSKSATFDDLERPLLYKHCQQLQPTDASTHSRTRLSDCGVARCTCDGTARRHARPLYEASDQWFWHDRIPIVRSPGRMSRLNRRSERSLRDPKTILTFRSVLWNGEPYNGHRGTQNFSSTTQANVVELSLKTAETGSSLGCVAAPHDCNKWCRSYQAELDGRQFSGVWCKHKSVCFVRVKKRLSP